MIEIAYKQLGFKKGMLIGLAVSSLCLVFLGVCFSTWGGKTRKMLGFFTI